MENCRSSWSCDSWLWLFMNFKLSRADFSSIQYPLKSSVRLSNWHWEKSVSRVMGSIGISYLLCLLSSEELSSSYTSGYSAGQSSQPLRLTKAGALLQCSGSTDVCLHCREQYSLFESCTRDEPANISVLRHTSNRGQATHEFRRQHDSQIILEDLSLISSPKDYTCLQNFRYVLLAWWQANHTFSSRWQTMQEGLLGSVLPTGRVVRKATLLPLMV